MSRCCTSSRRKTVPTQNLNPDVLMTQPGKDWKDKGVTIEAVIWDFGGVFTTSPFEAFNRFEARQGLPRDHIRTVNATNPDANAWALFERAEIDAQGFDGLFLEES